MPGAGGLGGTFGGNPVSCAASLAAVDVIATRIPWRGQQSWARSSVAAIELVRDRTTKEPARDETAQGIRGCYERGLVILRAGVFDNVVRLLPPLTIGDEDLEAGLGILEEALAETSSR